MPDRSSIPAGSTCEYFLIDPMQPFLVLINHAILLSHVCVITIIFSARNCFPNFEISSPWAASSLISFHLPKTEHNLSDAEFSGAAYSAESSARVSCLFPPRSLSLRVSYILTHITIPLLIKSRLIGISSGA